MPPRAQGADAVLYSLADLDGEVWEDTDHARLVAWIAFWNYLLRGWEWGL